MSLLYYFFYKVQQSDGQCALGWGLLPGVGSRDTFNHDKMVNGKCKMNQHIPASWVYDSIRKSGLLLLGPDCWNSSLDKSIKWMSAYEISLLKLQTRDNLLKIPALQKWMPYLYMRFP